jgi:ceroid-lipofuscinosis MFS transporter 7
MEAPLDVRREQLLASLGLTLQQRNRSLLCLAILWFFAGVEYAVILPTLWLYLQELQMGKHWFLGVVLSAFAAASMISAPVFGLFADKGRIKRLLVAASVFMVAGNMLYFIADDGYVVLEGRFIAGWGAGVASASFAYLARVSLREERTQVIGTVMAARQLGLLLGPCLNFGMTHLHIPLGPYEITSLTVPGILMAVLWAFTGAMCVFLFQDLEVPTSAPSTRVASRRVSRQPSYSNLAAHVQASERTALLGAEPRTTAKATGVMVPKAIADTGEKLQEQEEEEEEEEEWEYIPLPTRLEEYTQLPVLSLFLVSFLCIFNQLALETWVTPFTQAYFDWHEQENR